MWRSSMRARSSSSASLRALGRAEPRVERVDGPRGVAEGREQAAALQAIERLEEGVLADGIVDHRHFLPAGDLVHPRDEVFLRVDDRMRRAMVARELRLRL